MKKLFFPPAARISRRQFWMAQIGYVVVSLVTGLIFKLLAQVIPNGSTEAGTYAVNGAAAIPFAVIGFGVSLSMLVSWILVSIKRFHDRDKGGGWLFIVLVPLVGQVWYLVELFFLAGTSGPNSFGPAPRPGPQVTNGGFSVAR